MRLLMLLVLLERRAWGKSPDFEVVATGVASGVLSYYRRDGEVYLAGITTNRWTVTRAALVERVEKPYVGWLVGYSYRIDRAVGIPDTIVGGDDAIVDLIDPSLPPIAEDADVYAVAHDVDGDGTVDLWARDKRDSVLLQKMLFLTSFDGVRRLPLPEDTTESLGAGPSPDRSLLDIDQDGFAEIFKASIKAMTPIGFYDSTIDASYATVHDGGPDGYTSPRWTIETEGAILDAVALQADGDPEREVLLLTSDYVWGPGYPSLSRARTVAIDDAHTPSPTLHTTPGSLDTIADVTVRGEMLKRLNDLDGDGFDEALLTVAAISNGQAMDYLVLSSAADYDVARPLAIMTKGSGYEIGSIILDIDSDGFEDLVGVAGGFPGTIRVWFGPLVDPTLTSPDTGDTGSRGETGDTGTADTAEPADTAATDEPTGASAPDPSGDTGETGAAAAAEAPPAGACGCAQGSPAALAVVAPLIALRRGRRRPGVAG